MRALCTDTSIILIAKDTHLNSDQGQSRHRLTPRATDTTIYCLWPAAIGLVAAARAEHNEHLETLRQFNILLTRGINVNCIRDEVIQVIVRSLTSIAVISIRNKLFIYIVTHVD